MGCAKQQWQEWQSFLCAEAEREEDARYEECQSALRLSMVCPAMVRKLGYPFDFRIVELCHLLLKADVELRRV